MLDKKVMNSENQHLNSSVTIIPNENNLKIENDIFYQAFDSNTFPGHGSIFRVFCMKNQLPIIIPDNGGFFWGRELLSLGIMSVIEENEELYLFLPDQLSKNQSSWIESNYSRLKEYKLLEVGLNIDGNFEEIFKDNHKDFPKTSEEIMDYVLEIINSRKISKGK